MKISNHICGSKGPKPCNTSIQLQYLSFKVVHLVSLSTSKPQNPLDFFLKTINENHRFIRQTQNQ